MLTKIILLILMKSRKDNKVTAYFLSDSEKILYIYDFFNWDEHVNDSSNCLHEQKLVPIFVELDPLTNSGRVNALDANKRLLKVQLSFQTALLLAQKNDLELFISQDVLIDKGFAITKKFIAEILQC